jgi:hypothetical protein
LEEEVNDRDVFLKRVVLVVTVVCVQPCIVSTWSNIP